MIAIATMTAEILYVRATTMIALHSAIAMETATPIAIAMMTAHALIAATVTTAADSTQAQCGLRPDRTKP